ncbi:hypothetical protein M758_6G162500 [Ceratodon purpureus]|uniref:Protein N-lysine methyltransferase METTL21A n=1 Tax=Ceratodon purpureus TaxID=3225 RepID=A0A8T0HGP9_CERPU|nr:hypothetical protein KC19_6G168900 [Ceratodon purpureus]KAG0570529.1 hypothetical protein KC19_6G168900 [Ceratodon purpureus]KAG0570530.1 hypothetical protein KC19_6G168900 [Ceratodon purpureus]KAG0614252.1 hypothetical protein M758_6G162500 [Ceratodon purpureus]KAG0614253.1 hypothetical protein M758_6G162500 [Ceratodon purpureus]
MEDVFNTPHACKVELEVLGHKLLLAQDPNSKHLGTTVWDSSMVFVKYLEKNSKKGEFSRAKLQNKRVVELGAGCGLSGLGMALLGCEVVVTDQVEVLPLLLRNTERNMGRAKYSASEYSHLGPIGSIEVAELNWGNQEQAEALNPPFDYIIGTDVVYKEYLLPPLLESILSLAGPKTTLLMGYELRASGVKEQLEELFSRHFVIKKIPHSKMDAKYQHSNIDLYIMRLIRSDAQSQEEDELLDEEELLSSQGPSASSLQIDELSCKTAQNLEASSINLSYGPSAKQTKEIADGKAVGLDTYGAKVSSNDSWEAGRVGSMAARLLHDVHVSLT